MATNAHWICNCPPGFIHPFTKKNCDDCGAGTLGEIKQCPVCGSSFEMLRKTHTYCDITCRLAALGKKQKEKSSIERIEYCKRQS